LAKPFLTSLEEQAAKWNDKRIFSSWVESEGRTL